MTATRPAHVRCETCVYWHDYKSTHRDGACAKSPPVMLEREEPAAWPICGDDDWCGEWRDTPRGNWMQRADPVPTTLHERVRDAAARAQ